MRQIIVISLVIGLGVSIAFAQNITRQNISGPYNIQINTFTGNVFLSRTDMAINHPHLPVNFSFAYNSYKDSLNLGYGKGWSFPYSMCYVEASGQSIFIERPDGRKDFFRKSGERYFAPTGIFDELTEYETGKFKLEDKYGMAYYFDEPTHKKLTSITDLNGNTIRLSYNNNQISSVTDAVNRTVQLSWSNGLLSSVRESNGSFTRTVSYQYSGGRLTRITNPDNSTIEYEYDDDFGFLDKVIDELGNEYHIFYNRDAYAAQISSCFQTVRMVYDLEKFSTAVIEKSGSGQLISTYYYNEDGVLQSKTGNCCGFDQAYNYDRDNNLSSLTDANNNFFGSNYDAEGNLLKATDPFGFTQNYSYTGSYDRLNEMQDKRGNLFNFGYDADFNLTQIDGPESGEIGMTYDEQGNISSLTDGRLQTTLYQYNELDHLTSITYPDETVERNTYDALGNLVSTKDANNNSIYLEYDVFDRPVKVSDDLNHAISYEYDAAGNMTKQVDANNNENTYNYDAHYRLTDVQTPEGGANYSYDAADNLTEITNANDNTWSKKYDKRGLMIAETDPLGNEIRFEYDANGNMILNIEPNGNVVSYTYDGLNRLTSKTYPGNKDVYDYDENGNLIYCANNYIEIRFAYDMENRLIEKEYVSWNKTIAYTYDENGNRASMTDTDSGTTIYEYDALNRLTKVTNGYGVFTEFEYDAGGRLTQQKNYNGTYTTYTYDVADRLLSLENKQKDGTVISAFNYQYDNNGNRTTIEDANGVTSNYSYDGDNRLTGVESNDGSTESYTFDGAGNRLSLTKNGATTNYNYDKANRIQNAGTSNYTFDENGNMITKTDDTGETTYEYDGENRLIKVTKPNGIAIQYRYDPMGNRLSKTTDGFNNQTQYVLDDDNVLMETDQNGNVEAHYTTALQIDSWLTIHREGESYVYHKDALGSTKSLTSANGNVSNSYEYDAYGNIVNEVSAIPNNYTYTGREWDEDLGLYYYRSRYYNAEKGRFIKEDLFEGLYDRPLSLNKYIYVEANPINYIDPLGRGKESIIKKLVDLGKSIVNRFKYIIVGVTIVGKVLFDLAKQAVKTYPNVCIDVADSFFELVFAILERGAKTFKDKAALRIAKEERKSKFDIYIPSNCENDDNEQVDNDDYYEYDNGNQDFSPIPNNPAFPDNDDYYEYTSDVNISIIRPFDPNEIKGPTGVGLKKWIPYNKPSSYTIYFENDPDLATAPAQKVVIYFPFDEPINPYSFRVGSFNFGNLTFEVPKNLSFLNKKLEVKDSVGVNVQFTTGIDLDNNRAYWILESLDPQSGLSSTLKANQGFLPINDTLSRKGEGYVNFTIEPYPIDPMTEEMVETGTIINAEADIIFDTELPISTPPIFNTIDANHPESEIEEIINVGLGMYQINWSGSDIGSGFAAIDLLVSENDGSFIPTQINIKESPFIFEGNVNNTYAFQTIGIDSVGLRELDENLPTEPTNIPGCIDKCASNYNPAATEDDGSCEPYETCPENTCFSIYTWDAETCACIETVVEDVCEYEIECTNVFVDPVTCECILEPIEGCPEEYFCDSEPGLMQTAKSFVCDGDFIYLSEAFSIVSENSVKAYLLHEEEEFKGENYIEISKTGRFESPGSVYNNLTLHVSAIMGPADSNGNPELDHRCTEWTPNSAPIVFLDPITVNLIEERCEGELYYVDISIQGGVGEISPRFAYSSVTDGKTSYQNISKDEILTFGPYPENGNYTIEVEGAKGCTGSWSSPYICEVEYQISTQNLNGMELFLLNHTNPDIKINSVQVFNANGQVTPSDISINVNQCEIAINNRVKGIFFAQLILSNDQIDYIKIIKH